MRIREFRSELWLPLTPEELFPFFCNAANLNAITPPWFHFKILTPQPIAMGVDALIDYKLRIRGLPMRWRTRISAWDPPRRFVDEQIRGPYRKWVHEHTFTPGEGGTLMRDVVQYSLRFDWLLHRHFVYPEIQRIFKYRGDVLRARFNVAA